MIVIGIQALLAAGCISDARQETVRVDMIYQLQALVGILTEEEQWQKEWSS